MQTKQPLTIRVFQLIVVVLLLAAQSCGSGKKESSKQAESENAKSAETLSMPDRDEMIHVVTELMDFQMEDTIQSGWQTFHYLNKSKEPHFFLLEKYPEGKTIEDGRMEVIPAFQKGMTFINQGKMDEAMAEFGKLPAWYQQVAFLGGTGLISPGHTALSTIQLEPGYYVLECYVKNQGVFHSAMGMTRQLIVTDDATGEIPPTADTNVHISGTDGISYTGEPAKGLQVFAVTFDDQKLHEHFVGHDVHLIRLEPGYDEQQLLKWMNWSVPGGLQSPEPERVTFLGGINDMPAGSTAYFTAILEPGNYAFIAEVPDAATKNMFKPFTVTD